MMMNQVPRQAIAIGCYVYHCYHILADQKQWRTVSAKSIAFFLELCLHGSALCPAAVPAVHVLLVLVLVRLPGVALPLPCFLSLCVLVVRDRDVMNDVEMGAVDRFHGGVILRRLRGHRVKRR